MFQDYGTFETMKLYMKHMKLYSRPEPIKWNDTVVYNESYEIIQSSKTNMFTFSNYSSRISSFPFPLKNAETFSLHLSSNASWSLH